MELNIDLNDDVVGFSNNTNNFFKMDTMSEVDSYADENKENVSELRSSKRRDNKDHYKSLLRSTSDLKVEYEQMKHDLHQSQEENKTLLQTKIEIEQTLSKTNERFAETKKALLQVMDAVAKREHELHVVESKWRNRVDQERNDVVEQRKVLRDHLQVEQNLRCQIRNEIMIEFDEKIKELTKEVGRFSYTLQLPSTLIFSSFN